MLGLIRSAFEKLGFLWMVKIPRLDTELVHVPQGRKLLG